MAIRPSSLVGRVGLVSPQPTDLTDDDAAHMPYRYLLTLPHPVLNALVGETLGAVLSRPRSERRRLIDMLWSRHLHDTDTAAGRALGVDPKTLRRRKDRVRTLTGLDPDRPADRFRLDLGLYALQLLAAVRSVPDHEDLLVRNSHEPGKRPKFAIADSSDSGSSFAPHSPHTPADRAGREEAT